MQNNWQDCWTERGWELLESLATDLMMFSQNPATAIKVMTEALKITQQKAQFPQSGNFTKNELGEDRYWCSFFSGQVLVWRIHETGAPRFLGAFHSLPQSIKV